MSERANLERDSMVWESAEEMNEHATLRVDYFEDIKGHASGRPRQVGFVDRSSCVKMLGMSLLVAQQVPTASAAESICQTFSNVGLNFDMIGLISAFGNTASTTSLQYSALIDSCFYLTGHVGPGSLRVAAALFEATGFHLARMLAFSKAGKDTDALSSLGNPEGLRYIGLKSNTECPVGNAVGASVVRGHRSLRNLRNMSTDAEKETRPTLGRCIGRDAKRRLVVIILTVEEEDPKNKVIGVSMTATNWCAFVCGLVPLLLTTAVIVSCCFCKQWVVAGLIVWGTLGMMLAVLGLRLCRFKYSELTVAKDSPEGDILVVDDTDPELLHIVKGKEETIQKLFQRKIVFESSLGKYVLFLAASILYIYVLVSLLYMSNAATSGQIHFAIANLIGLVADMAKASQHGKLGLAKKACEKFKIVKRDDVLFMNRTAAVAFVAKHAKDRAMLKTKKLLPCDGYVWQTWWNKLAASDPKVEDLSSTDPAAATKKEQDLLTTLIGDMKDGLEA